MKKILVVVDYQKDFVNGSLGFDKAATLEKAIGQKIEQYKQNGNEVVFTLDTHNDNYLQIQEGKNLPFPHCIRNTEGWNVYGKIADLCDETTKCFEKATFGSLELVAYLANKEYDRVELIGVVSNICVISQCHFSESSITRSRNYR